MGEDDEVDVKVSKLEASEGKSIGRGLSVSKAYIIYSVLRR